MGGDGLGRGIGIAEGMGVGDSSMKRVCDEALAEVEKEIKRRKGERRKERGGKDSKSSSTDTTNWEE